jgi:hypothetical protein
MILRSFVSPLLPAAYREQVLGDLQERGFRLTDIASVLPRIWWSHLLRSLTVPILTGASEATLRRRATQFARRRIFLVSDVLAMAVLLQAFNDKIQDSLGILAVGLTAFLIGSDLTFRLGPPLPTGREAWLDYHRKQLQEAFQASLRGGPGFPYTIFLAAFNVLNHWQRDPAILMRVVAMLVALNAIFALARLRAARLRKELELLQ